MFVVLRACCFHCLACVAVYFLGNLSWLAFNESLGSDTCYVVCSLFVYILGTQPHTLLLPFVFCFAQLSAMTEAKRSFVKTYSLCVIIYIYIYCSCLHAFFGNSPCATSSGTTGPRATTRRVPS